MDRRLKGFASHQVERATSRPSASLLPCCTLGLCRALPQGHPRVTRTTQHPRCHRWPQLPRRAAGWLGPQLSLPLAACHFITPSWSL